MSHQPNQAPMSNSNIKAAARKLPIKRKSPERPTPNPKFQRIWTEPDELIFLHTLLNPSKTQGLIFPKDLPLFYNRCYNDTNNTMWQTYTRSQLGEKLRRLRKKFRVASARIQKGLDFCLLSVHDRALFDLSKKLWHPEFNENSPFNPDRVISNVVPMPAFEPLIPPFSGDAAFVTDEGDVGYEVGEEEEEKVEGGGGRGIADIVVKSVLDVFEKAVLDVFEKSVGEAKMGMEGEGEKKEEREFEKRWRELRGEEMGVMAKRLRLMAEDALASSASKNEL